jgi:hypothetical protein
MEDCKPLSVPIFVGAKISMEQSPTTPVEMEDMASIPYTSAVGSLMCVIFYTTLDVAQVMKVLSQFMANPRREHHIAVKRLFRYL